MIIKQPVPFTTKRDRIIHLSLQLAFTRLYNRSITAVLSSKHHFSKGFTVFSSNLKELHILSLLEDTCSRCIQM